MYLRKQGRRIYLLQSYRDGQGRVCQRRLGHFTDWAGWQRQRAELALRRPELRGEFEKLSERAESMLVHQPITKPPQVRAQAIRGLVRALLNKLAEEEDEEVLGSLDAELRELGARLGHCDPDGLMAEAEQQLQQGDLEEAEASLHQVARLARATLPTRRQRFDSSDPKARLYLDALDRLSDVLLKQSQCEDAVEVLAERVSCCPSSSSRLLYGSLLQKLGRKQEAAEQYSRLPKEDSFRHYNLASVSWQTGSHDEALLHLLRGLTCNPEPVMALDQMIRGKEVLRGGEYWQTFGEFWDFAGRQFILTVTSQPWVRRRLRIVREQGTRVRNLVSAHSRAWILERGLAAAGI